jgi:hypothetical protein
MCHGGTELRDQQSDFATVMATHSARDHYACLQLFIHCKSDDPSDCFDKKR